MENIRFRQNNFNLQKKSYVPQDKQSTADVFPARFRYLPLTQCLHVTKVVLSLQSSLSPVVYSVHFTSFVHPQTFVPDSKKYLLLMPLGNGSRLSPIRATD